MDRLLKEALEMRLAKAEEDEADWQRRALSAVGDIGRADVAVKQAEVDLETARRRLDDFNVNLEECKKSRQEAAEEIFQIKKMLNEPEGVSKVLATVTRSVAPPITIPEE